MCNAWCLEFAERLVPHLAPPARLLEVGSRDVNGSARQLLATHADEYVGVDITPGAGVDLILDVAGLSAHFGSEQFDAVVSTEMLEHCPDWQDAVYQMARVLRPGGLLLITTRSPGFELHDYPGDYWRFSYSDFREIFEPLGELVALERDLTLGWPCGVGVIVRRRVDDAALARWYEGLRARPVFSMQQEAEQLGPVVLFDQYSRYRACAELLQAAGAASGTGTRVLDAGSGPECLLGRFLPGRSITFVDPQLTGCEDDRHIGGDLGAAALNGRRFDYVVSVDTLEHVPAAQREAFIDRIAGLAEKGIVLAFPCADQGEPIETDRAVLSAYEIAFGAEYSWLKEHAEYGLPNLAAVTARLEAAGWHCVTVGHGHAPWLRELLPLVACAWEIPAAREVMLELSERFNRKLYRYDFAAPFYRYFVVATRTPSTLDPDTFITAVPPQAEAEFIALQRDALRAVLPVMAKLSKGNSELEQRLEQRQRKLMEISDWATALNGELCDLRSSLFARGGARQRKEVRLHVDRLELELAQLRSEREQADSVREEWRRRALESEARTAAGAARLAEAHRTAAAWKIRAEQCDGELIALRRDFETTRSAEAVALSRRLRESEQQLADKHAELMKMSDWAYGMMLELKRLDASRLGSAVRTLLRESEQWRTQARAALKRSFVGDWVRRMRRRSEMGEARTTFEQLRASIAANDGNLVVTFPIIPWNFRWQRPQHIVTRLRDRGFAVLYVAMTVAAKERRYSDSNDAALDLTFSELERDVHQVWLHSEKPLIVYTDPIADGDLHNMVSGLAAVLETMPHTRLYYLLQFPGWSGVATELKRRFGGKVIFDCMDDHGGFSTNTAVALKNEEQLIEHADLVITSSNLLEERARILNPRTIQVKNGTEFVHFNRAQKNGALDHIEGPVIGYYGAISDWFDLDLLAYCALERPEWSFVLVGATAGCDVARVNYLPNIHFLGEKPYAELPGYFAYFDVCTIPFKIIPLTLATNPVKFYEYMSAGKPVVSIELPELLPYQDDCYLARNKTEFLAQLSRALAEKDDAGKVERRIALARANSWDARVETIMESGVFNS